MSHGMASKAVVWGRADPPQPDIALTLWGVGSRRALRAHWMLAELGVPYVSYRIQPRTGETMDPDYLKLNPRHKIPLLQHGHLTLTVSAAIVHYLAESFDTPDGLFIPTDGVQRAKVKEWCYFIMNELDGHTLYVIRRHVGLEHIYGSAPEAVESAKVYFRDQILALEVRFDDLPGYLFGDRLSTADILLTTCLEWGVSVGIELPEAVLAYCAGVTRRPAFAEAKRRNDPTIAPPRAACLFPDARNT
jgi:glutathione S-transferase